MAVRWIVPGLWFFVGAALVGLFFALAGPVALIRVFGAIALSCAICGAALHAWAYRDALPDRWAALRRSLAATLSSTIARLHPGDLGRTRALARV